jgi:hypothetical protein
VDFGNRPGSRLDWPMAVMGANAKTIAVNNRINAAQFMILLLTSVLTLREFPA